MSFSGKGREFLRLLVTGSLFQIPTVGFYRFWLVTKLRRHLWSNTRVGGEAFEYTGTAKELLIGFLIALAVLTPIYLGYFLLGLMLEEKKALASLPLILVLYALAHFGAYRARRYRATRTVFRGVRFWMTGSGWAYAGRAILWDIAVILSLGLALPWAAASLERYRMRHTWFGTIQGDFVGSGWTLFKRAGWIWGAGILIAATVFVLAALQGGDHDKNVLLGEVLGSVAIALICLWGVALSIFTRWQMEGIRFGEVAVSCRLEKTAFLGLFLKLIGSSMVYLVCFGLVAGAVVLAFWDQFIRLFAVLNPALAKEAVEELAQSGQLGSIAIPIALMAMAYLALLLGMGVIKRYFMGRGLWAVVVRSLAVANLQAVDRAAAAGTPSGVVGEGLADALDFSVGI